MTIAEAPDTKAHVSLKTKMLIGAAIVVIGLFVYGANRTHEPTAQERSSDARRACQDVFVSQRLKAPATAQWANMNVTQVAGRYTVTGDVDSQNGFGALVRSRFSCSVHSAGNRWLLDSASVG